MLGAFGKSYFRNKNLIRQDKKNSSIPNKMLLATKPLRVKMLQTTKRLRTTKEQDKERLQPNMKKLNWSKR